jgi:hypothetical protein
LFSEKEQRGRRGRERERKRKKERELTPPPRAGRGGDGTGSFCLVLFYLVIDMRDKSTRQDMRKKVCANQGMTLSQH